MPETARGMEVSVSSLPDCQFCEVLATRLNLGKVKITPAHYDFKTRQGPWANGCLVHYRMHRMYQDLGTGKGQRLKVKS